MTKNGIKESPPPLLDPQETLKDFKLGNFPLEQKAIEYWPWILVIGPYLSLVILGSLYALVDRTFPILRMRWTWGIFTDPIFLIFLIFLSLVAWAFMDWVRLIPNTFNELWAKGHIHKQNNSDNLEQKYTDFIQEFKDKLKSNKRYFVVALFEIIAVVFWLQAEAFSYYHLTKNHLLDIIGFAHILVMYVYTPFIWLYFVGIGAWTTIITGNQLRELANDFRIKPIAVHPDKSGGMYFLGDFAFKIARPILIEMIMMALIIIWGTFLGGLNYTQEMRVVVFSTIFLIPIIFVIAYLAFFGPLYGIHQEMLAERKLAEGNYINKYNKLRENLEEKIDSGDGEAIQDARSALEAVELLNPTKLGFPVWPFNRTILLRFFSPQVLPLISLMLNLIDKDTKAMWSELFTILFEE